MNLEKHLSAGQAVISNPLLEDYHRVGLQSEKFLFILQLHVAQLERDTFPGLQMIAINMGIKQDQTFRILDRLVTNGLIKIETTDVNGKKADRYNLYPVYDQLSEYLKTQEEKHEEKVQEKEIQSVYQLFEQEFGRLLFSIGFQRINQWLEEDHYQPEILKLALREAVLNQAYSLDYIDRILLSWGKKNLRTKQQVEEDQRRRKQQLLQREVEQPTQQEELPKVPLKDRLKE